MGETNSPFRSQFNTILWWQYNKVMVKHKGLFVVALVLLAVSIGLLLWGFWPLVHQTHVLPLPPDTLQLPAPAGFLQSVYPIC